MDSNQLMCLGDIDFADDNDDFAYLRSKMQGDGDSEPDVKQRLSKASQAFSVLKRCMEIKETQLQHQDPYL